MNKTQLIEQLQKPLDQVDSLLKAAGIATSLEIYTLEHLKTLQALDEMVVSGKAKTHRDAAKSYRQQQNTPTTTEPVIEAFDQDTLLMALAEEAANAALEKFPELAREQHDSAVAAFVQRYRQYLAQGLQSPEYRQKFQAVIQGRRLGKSNILENTTSNTALPGG